jgi:hypothetical protein
MVADKFVDINAAGRIRERTPIDTSTGAADAGKLVKLAANGKFSTTVIPGINVTDIIAFEALSANDAIHIFDDAGVGKMRKANAATGLQAHGFVPAAVGAGISGRAQLDDQVLSGFVGLTIGAQYFLSDVTAGAITATPPTTSGYLLQSVGVARSATELAIDISEPIERG